MNILRKFPLFIFCQIAFSFLLTNAYQLDNLEEPCEIELANLCHMKLPTVEQEFYEARVCLYGNKDSLSDTCLNYIYNTHTSIIEPCIDDLQKNCQGIIAGNNRLHMCLFGLIQSKEISNECFEALEEESYVKVPEDGSEDLLNDDDNDDDESSDDGYSYSYYYNDESNEADDDASDNIESGILNNNNRPYIIEDDFDSENDLNPDLSISFKTEIKMISSITYQKVDKITNYINEFYSSALKMLSDTIYSESTTQYLRSEK